MHLSARRGCRLRGDAPARALIVDDDQDTRDLYALSLRAAGWAVEGAANGQEALGVAAGFEPDVIVIDLCLPVVDGFEAVRRLKEDPATSHALVVACTALDRADAEVRARVAGCAGFVRKPCLPDDLRVLLERLLARRG